MKSDEISKIIASASDRFAATAELLRSWKGVQTAEHQARRDIDGDWSVISLSIEVETQQEAFWCWLVEFRWHGGGWKIRDHRQSLNERGIAEATDMPGHEGTTLDELLVYLEKSVTDVLKNIDGGWWLRVKPAGTAS